MESNNQISFRKAEEKDIVPVNDLCRLLAGIPGSPWDEEYPNIEIIRWTYEMNGLYVGESDGRIAATVGLVGCGEDDEVFTSAECWNKEHKRPCIGARLGVHPDFQGRRIAEKMVDYALGQAKEQGFDSIHFFVDPDNDKALRLYARMGFTECGEADWIEMHWKAFEKTL